MAMTISDIARLAGVSRATVSGVLNNSPLVSAKTKKRVLEIIEKHNYKPNEIARALTLKQTGILGLIVKDITNPLYGKIAIGVEEACSENGYNVIIGNSQQQWELEVSKVSLLKRRRVDGLVIFPIQKGVDLSHIWELKKEDYPFALLAEVPGIEADLIRADDEKGAFEATQHLIHQGRKCIAYISGPDTALANDRRMRGYQQALATYDIVPKDELVLNGGWRLEDGYRAGKKMVQQHQKCPDGVFCYNDQVATGFIRAMVESGLNIPENVAVVGFDDAGVSAYLETALTTVEQPARKIGRMAAEILLKRIADKNSKSSVKTPIQKVLLPTRLIVRESCGSAAKGKIPSINDPDDDVACKE